jgi:hypothetical protein
MGSSTGVPSDLFKCDFTMEETEISKIRKNIISLKLSKNNINPNKSDLNLYNTCNKKPVFVVSSNNLLNQSTSLITNSNNLQSNKLNLSCNLSLTFTNSGHLNKRRGRKKLLFDGVKTEIIDKAFLREFKNYIKKYKYHLKNIFDDLKNEEKIFWNEFLQNNNPPFFFTHNHQKVEYKSFSKSLLKFIFSHPSVKQLYSIFIKEKEKELVNSIVNKKIKKIDRKMLLFYSFYGKNIHKLYSNDYNINDINIDDIEGYGTTSSSTNVFSNISDSLTLINNSTSI